MARTLFCVLPSWALRFRLPCFRFPNFPRGDTGFSPKIAPLLWRQLVYASLPASPTQRYSMWILAHS
jgi:hypothetical protein